MEVKDPAGYSDSLKAAEAAALVDIQPIPLKPNLERKHWLQSALLLTVVHFPWDDGHRAECVESAVGLRLVQRVCQGKRIQQLSYPFGAVKFHTACFTIYTTSQPLTDYSRC